MDDKGNEYHKGTRALRSTKIRYTRYASFSSFRKSPCLLVSLSPCLVPGSRFLVRRFCTLGLGSLRGARMPQRILIVDDERKLVQGLTAYFRQAGYETLAAYDGRSALDSVHRDRPDLVVLDLMLPELDGIEVCRQIRRSSAIPIMMLTARVEETDMLVGLEIGADDYIAKPFSPRE